MAKLYFCYPPSPLTKESKRLINTKKPKRETTEPYSSTRLGGNFPTSVVARKSSSALLLLDGLIRLVQIFRAFPHFVPLLSLPNQLIRATAEVVIRELWTEGRVRWLPAQPHSYNDLVQNVDYSISDLDAVRS